LNVTERRLLLRAAEYRGPIPLRGKNPAMKKDWAWQTLGDASPEQIAMWAKVFPDARNTGLLTRLCPAFDIDIEVPEAAEAVEALARELAEERGYVLVRFGRAPKRAILFRTNEPGFPIVNQVLTAPDGSEQRVELLASGQQLAAFGTHPETHQLYSWHGGEPGNIKFGECGGGHIARLRIQQKRLG
jgi:hypothetical protein